MGIAYTNGPIVYTTLRCDTSVNFRSDLDAVFTKVGATRASITNGYKYTMTSPQGFKCKLRVQDTGSQVSTSGFPPYNTLEFQIMSFDEVLQGITHQIIYGAAIYVAKGYEIIANQCQFFLALKGVADRADLGGFGLSRYNSVAAGIPYVVSPAPGSDCAASGGSTAAPSQIFWSSGQAIFNFDFRTAWFPTGYFCYCLNGVITIYPVDSSLDAGNDLGTLKIYPLTPTQNIVSGYYGPDYTPIVKYVNHDPMYVDALIGWNWSIQGQLYDAFQATAEAVLDSIIVLSQNNIDGKPVTANFIAWNHDITGFNSVNGTYYSTLCLLTGPPIVGGGGGAGNYAY